LKITGAKDAVSGFCEKFQRTLKNEVDRINGIVDDSIPNYVYGANVLMVIIFNSSLKYLSTHFFKIDW
jgi:hypothetical protein